MDLLDLYRQMARMRAFELTLAALWHEGRIAGEMHLATGEEALVAGLATHLQDGDALALDHRSTPFFLARGVDPVALLREMLGRPDGLCRGRGGHMHLFAPGLLMASSGIVGAAGPLACGFGLAARRLRPGSVAVATFGEGAVNQGMLLESWNLAVAWKLPVVFVCKDNGWAITTRSAEVTGGDLLERARGFGLHARDVDGLDPIAVGAVAGPVFERARRGHGPSFLRATCTRLDGHFLGDPVRRVVAAPVRQGRELMGEILASTLRLGGAGVGDRATSVVALLEVLQDGASDRRDGARDPLVRARKALAASHAEPVRRIDAEVTADMARAVRAALAPWIPGEPGAPGSSPGGAP